MSYKNLFFALLTGIAFTGLAFTTSGDPVVLKADIAKSTINWKGYKVAGSQSGIINLKNGELKFEEGKLIGGYFEIDMASIHCTNDISNKMKAKLEKHLKSADFFGVEKYPTSKFIISKVASRGTPGDYKITGDLTIKETTKEIKFNAHYEDNAATAKITVDRSDFDVRYGSGSFFGNLGNKTIYDEFDLEVNLVVTK